MNISASVSYLVPGSERPYYTLHRTPEQEPARSVRGDRRDMHVVDGRTLDPPPCLEREGVEKVAWDAVPEDEHDQEGVERDFYPQVEALVREATGAPSVHAFDHNVRSSNRALADGMRIQRPVFLAHNDYTEKSGPQRVRDLFPATAENLLAGRVAVINVWKPIRVPALDSPLAICDAQTIQARDMIETDLRYADRTGEIYSFAHSPKHRWLYYPAMQPSETLLIKCYDSRRNRARFTAHTAITDPGTPKDAPPRQSIEVRTLAFFAR